MSVAESEQRFPRAKAFEDMSIAELTASMKAMNRQFDAVERALINARDDWKSKEEKYYKRIEELNRK